MGLSLSPCHRQVRALEALEASGAIKGYKAILDASVIGLGFSAIVFVTIKEGDKKAVEEFENAIIGIPQIVQAQRLFGDPDFLLHIVADDLPASQRFYDEQLTDVPGVQRLISTIVMKNVVPERPFPFT